MAKRRQRTKLLMNQVVKPLQNIIDTAQNTSDWVFYYQQEIKRKNFQKMNINIHNKIIKSQES
jgi:hypothetical protein